MHASQGRTWAPKQDAGKSVGTEIWNCDWSNFVKSLLNPWNPSCHSGRHLLFSFSLSITGLHVDQNLHSQKDPIQQSSSEQSQHSKHANSFALQIKKKGSGTSHFCKSPKIRAFSKESQYEFIISRLREVQTQSISHRQAKPRKPSCLLISGNRGALHTSPEGAKSTAQEMPQGR